MSKDLEDLIAMSATFPRIPLGRQYWRERIPNEIDQEISARLREIRARTLGERELLVNLVTPENAGVLIGYADRMATLAVRTLDEDVVQLGLWAFVLAWREIGDPRDALRCLAPLYDAATRIGPGAGLFEAVAAQAPSDIASVLIQFVGRSDLADILSLMGFAVTDDEDGFRYRA